jgi:hypothetical protein
MTIYINDKPYKDGSIFRVAIDPEFKMLSSMDSPGRREILKLPVGLLQHGMTIISGNTEDRIKKIHIDSEDKRPSFYYMHIYKTSGLSINTQMTKRFVNSHVYNNYIGLIDDQQILNSKLISGHLASYPIDLFKENNLPLHSFTIIRNPVDRVISHYFYENNIRNNGAPPNPEDMYNFVHNNKEILTDLQTKNITSSIDSDFSNKSSNSFLSGDISLLEFLKIFGETSRFLEQKTNEDKWADHLEKFSLIGTIDNRDKFINSLQHLFDKELYNGTSFENIYINKSITTTSDFKKTLPKDLIDFISNINKNDFDLYDMLLSRGL